MFVRALGLIIRIAILGLLASVALVLPLRWVDVPTSAFMLRARAMGEVETLRYRWRTWVQISPHLKVAVVASEDQKFPTHAGFDFESIARATRERRPVVRGASTISQQVAKNLFLWPGRSLVRKGIEAWFTVLIETLWPKRRILEVYLNVAEFGPGVYGAGAASEVLLRKAPIELTSYDAALLAAVLPNPKLMSLTEPSEYVRGRAAEIQRAVEALGGPKYLSGI